MITTSSITMTILRPWLLAAACLLCAACVDGLDDEHLGVTEQTLTSTVAATAAGPHMNTPAGTKVIAGYGNRLHAVYTDGGHIKYTTSDNGVDWTAAVDIGGTPATSPTIAVAADGTIGVAYRKGALGSTEIHYLSRSPGSSWSPSFKVTSDGRSGPGGVAEPSLVALGKTMHLAWSASSYVFYASFLANQAVPLATAEEVDHGLYACAGTQLRYRPTIAVSRRSAVDASPRVRVAFFDGYDNEQQAACPSSYFGFVVAERPANGGTWSYVLDRTVDFVGIWNSANGTSLSLAAIPTTGDFYVAASSYFQGVATTQLWYENAWNTDAWRSQTLLTNQSIVDVTAQVVDCVPSIRYAINDFTQGANGYGPISYRTGRWFGAQAAAPTWTDAAPIQVHASGNNAEALFFRKSAGGSTRYVPTVYEELVNNTSAIVEETTVIAGTVGAVPCSPMAQVL